MELKDETCNLCGEVKYKVGEVTDYGAIVVHKYGSLKDGWFVTISPKSGSNPLRDFTLQLMPFAHLTHFSELGKFPELANNYGLVFGKINKAIATILLEDQDKSGEDDPFVLSVGSYGKCTTYPPKCEHLHLKLFPFKGAIGQPYTVDSSFGKKETFTDENGEKYVKMIPVVKKPILSDRLNFLASRIISLTNEI